MTSTQTAESFLDQCRNIAQKGQNNPKVSSFHPIGGELETFAHYQETFKETHQNANHTESLIEQQVSTETRVETFRKPPLKKVETFTPKNTPESFQVSTTGNLCSIDQKKAEIDRLILSKITKDDRPYIRFHLDKIPEHLRLKILYQYFDIYQRAFDQCSNINGQDNAGRRAGNVWLRTEGQSWK